MRIDLVPIGNSRGIRIPKAVLDQTGLRGKVELEVRGSQLVISAANHPRTGWEEAFAAMSAQGDDALLDVASPSKWDEAEWHW